MIEIDPNNWRAIFEKGKAAAWQSTLANIRISELYQAVIEANKIVDGMDIDVKEKSAIKNEFAVTIYRVNNAITDLMEDNLSKRIDLYFESNWDDMWNTRQRALTNVEKIEDAMTLIFEFEDDLSKSNIIEFKKRICTDLIYACGYWRYWHDYSESSSSCFGFSAKEKKPYVDKFWKLVSEIRETTPDYATTKYSQIDPFDPPERGYDISRSERIFEHWKSIDAELNRKRDMAERQRELDEAKKRFEDYWEAHSEEKTALEKRLSAIQEEKAQLQHTISDFDGKIAKIRKEQEDQFADVSQELNALKAQISSLEMQKNKLGFFAGKQKKDIQAKIDSLKALLPNIEEKVMRDMTTIRSDIDTRLTQIYEEKKPYFDRMSALVTEETNIKSELTKAR